MFFGSQSCCGQFELCSLLFLEALKFASFVLLESFSCAGTAKLPGFATFDAMVTHSNSRGSLLLPFSQGIDQAGHKKDKVSTNRHDDRVAGPKKDSRDVLEPAVVNPKSDEPPVK